MRGNCRASHFGDAIRGMYSSSVSVGVVHVLFARARTCRAQCDVLFIPQLVTILPHIFLSHFCLPLKRHHIGCVFAIFEGFRNNLPLVVKCMVFTVYFSQRLAKTLVFNLHDFQLVAKCRFCMQKVRTSAFY